MSIVEVKVPQLSESVAEATLLEWKKQVGQAVKQDEILIEVETDKVILEVPSPVSGVIVELAVQNGATVIADQLIAKIDTTAVAQSVPTQPVTNEAMPSKVGVAQESTPPATAIAMPSAAKLMAENQVSQVTGTGRDGRVTKGDVLAALEASPDAPKVKPAQSSMPEVIAVSHLEAMSGRPEERVPMSRLRARIAERLVLSQQTNAILTTFNEVNMQPVIDLRNKFKEKFEKNHGVKLGFMSFFVKAVLAGLKKYPIINASVDGNDIVYHGYFDIGIAVGSPRGLVVPVLRNVDQMSFADIEKQISDFSQRASQGKLSIEELSGGTFSISNGGVFGSMMSTPIINPPQSAILGVHATKDRPVVENGQIVIRPMNYLAVSYDHRIIDGREAVLFLVAVKEALEDPAKILLDL